MAKNLLINFNLFDANQIIYLLDTENQTATTLISSVPVNEISNVIGGLIQTEGIEGIDLRGHEQYIVEFGNSVLNELVKKYSDRNVRIYLNGEIFN